MCIRDRSIIIGAVAAGGAGVAAAASQGKARLASVFKRGKSSDIVDDINGDDIIGDDINDEDDIVEDTSSTVNS